MTNNEAILTYVRYQKEDQLVEKILFAKKLKDTMGKLIFEMIQKR